MYTAVQCGVQPRPILCNSTFSAHKRSYWYMVVKLEVLTMVLTKIHVFCNAHLCCYINSSECSKGCGVLEIWVNYLPDTLDFSVTYSFRPYRGPGVDSAPSVNEYQEHFLWVKAAGVWGWPHHLHVPNVMEIWEPKPPGKLWATPGLLWDSFTFYLPDTGIFHSHNPSGRTMALGLTQPLTEMSTSNISRWVKVVGV